MRSRSPSPWGVPGGASVLLAREEPHCGAVSVPLVLGDDRGIPMLTPRCLRPRPPGQPRSGALSLPPCAGQPHTPTQGGREISSACSARRGRWGPARSSRNRRGQTGRDPGPGGRPNRAGPPLAHPAARRDPADRGGRRSHLPPNHPHTPPASRAVPGGAEVQAAGAGLQRGAAEGAEGPERGGHGGITLTSGGNGAEGSAAPPCLYIPPVSPAPHGNQWRSAPQRSRSGLPLPAPAQEPLVPSGNRHL